MKTKILAATLTILLTAAGVAMAQQTSMPAEDISRHRHPNLEKAQHLVDKAYEHIVSAQQNNEFDFGGHAQHAKELLDQANNELKQAAVFENEHPEKR